MNSPGSKDSYWSGWSKRKIDSMFKDKKEYTCLQWRCGKYEFGADSIFSNPEDVKALDKECFKYYNREKYQLKLDKMMTDIEYKTFIDGYWKKT